ncbi:hypothetical protein SNEBB_002121 [Seison nebaliae]|nr:hypothetical protein SNEBB_002121 [Seison nebaliae]
MTFIELWQDRDLRFDRSVKEIKCRTGEFILDTLKSVEDHQGNSGEEGSLVVSSLRLIWFSKKDQKINLSIGYNTMISMSVKKMESKIRGSSESLYIMCKLGETKYEFTFINLEEGSPRIFTSVMSVFKSYESSKLYREIKLRSALFYEGQLNLLPDEEISNSVSGVWNLANEEGNLGKFYITNIRIIWHADHSTEFNVSLPYIQISNIRIRQCKFGKALVIESFRRRYVLGFRIDPIEKLTNICKEQTKLLEAFHTSPMFGIKVDFSGDKDVELPQWTEELDEDIEIDEKKMKSDAIASYITNDSTSNTKTPVYCEELGVTIQQLKEGYTIEQILQIL